MAPGDTVRIRGNPVLYKVIAVNGCMLTILVMNPQPDGQYLDFSPTSIQTIDEYRVEKVDDC
ncbi:hypothetical protein QC763_300185 [Podospora pseudopauciseta]|uniref:Phage protein n=2 Tax=Podospora TaxID=5144 RepID=A0ABR0HEY4_9PEZI|nr:hypothetical protein QC763_300185 [Podospora pseudopauciseta]KAK4677594.1 hypothetical protein QC764_300185 [Podospora pseudoanserina]